MTAFQTKTCKQARKVFHDIANLAEYLDQALEGIACPLGALEQVRQHIWNVGGHTDLLTNINHILS